MPSTNNNDISSSSGNGVSSGPLALSNTVKLAILLSAALVVFLVLVGCILLVRTLLKTAKLRRRRREGDTNDIELANQRSNHTLEEGLPRYTQTSSIPPAYSVALATEGSGTLEIPVPHPLPPSYEDLDGPFDIVPLED
ncbi:hypothetical protein CROQUDRAFT_86106 [Cronartium quercuum f. sp. fusiforme G11]|uniref:Uncharacterized protein n=1 Tax=Cronartium quercuum f. sp. fusiforme G11 TaxID=708437 RepID=A0A9P6NTD6_9BASI|nr:hypothetical protein CROQUDRAFT_86106 [Cronartium quercuum f. sp. fusiforme G11]